MSDCIDPSAIREGDLLAYVDGMASQQVTSHVRACVGCTARVAELRSAQARLAVSLQRACCPPADVLGDFYLALLPPGQKLAVARHVQVCSLCTHELAEFAAPSATTDLFAPLGGLTPAIKAVLTALPLPVRQPALATRGMASSQRLYRAHDVDILLGYQLDSPQHGALSGVIIQPQQVPSAMSGIQVQLFREEGLVADTTINDLGDFHFAGIEPGVYDLTFDWREQMVLISEIRCGAP